MHIVSALRSASVATVLVVATIAYAPAFAQDQFQPSATSTAPTGHQEKLNAPYSGSGSADAAAKQGEGCQSNGGPIQAPRSSPRTPKARRLMTAKPMALRKTPWRPAAANNLDPVVHCSRMGEAGLPSKPASLVRSRFQF